MKKIQFFYIREIVAIYNNFATFYYWSQAWIKEGCVRVGDSLTANINVKAAPALSQPKHEFREDE